MVYPRQGACLEKKHRSLVRKKLLPFCFRRAMVPFSSIVEGEGWTVEIAPFKNKLQSVLLYLVNGKKINAIHHLTSFFFYMKTQYRNSTASFTLSLYPTFVYVYLTPFSSLHSHINTQIIEGFSIFRNLFFI